MPSNSEAEPPGARQKPAPRRKRRSPEEIRSRLIHAAQQEFKRFGYIGATTSAIAGHADVTEAQLFRYYGSKQALFREAVFDPLNEHFSEFIGKHLPEADGAETYRERASLYINELEQFLGEHSKLLLSLVVAQMFTPEDMEEVGEIESLRTYFERGAATMDSRLGDEARVDPRLLVRVSFAAVLGCVLFRDWLFPRGLAGDEDISAAIVDFVVDGINVNSSRD